MRKGQAVTLEAGSIVGIGEALIKARVVRNLTQKELAERLARRETVRGMVKTLLMELRAFRDSLSNA